MDRAILDLPSVSVVDGSEILYAVQGGVSRTMSVEQILAASADRLLKPHVNFTEFGGVGDGATDNAAALIAFRTWARTESLAGRAVTLDVSPGVYKFNHANCQSFLSGIHKLTIYGNGATFQNSYDPLISGANFGYELPWPAAGYADLSGIYTSDANNQPSLIVTALKGATTVTLTTPTEHAKYTVGTYVMIGSLDTQMFGYPPNCEQFDFVKITAKNTSTGVITLEVPLTYEHRADFPDGDNNVPCGKARIYRLDTNLGTWDVEHTYHDLRILQAATSELPYFSITGRSTTFVNCDLPAISPSVAGECNFIGGRIRETCEPDKLVRSMSFLNTTIMGATGFQSSSIDRASFHGCYLNDMTVGSVKSFFADSCYIGSYGGPGSTCGQNRSTTLINCQVRSASEVQAFGSTLPAAATIDGSAITFANGVLSIIKAGSAYHAYTPGAFVALKSSAGYAGERGVGIITRAYEDATHVRYETTLPYATLPAWANGEVHVRLYGTETYINCFGCDQIRRASEATQRGKTRGEFFRYLYLGATSANGYFSSMQGVVQSITVNVIQPTALTGAKFRLSFLGSPLGATMDDPQDYYVEVDLTARGVRTFTPTALTGKKTGDTVMLGSTAQTAGLPIDRYHQGSAFWAVSGYTPSSYEPYQLPIFELEVQFDNGLLRRTLSSLSDADTGIIAAITGTLP